MLYLLYEKNATTSTEVIKELIRAFEAVATRTKIKNCRLTVAVFDFFEKHGYRFGKVVELQPDEIDRVLHHGHGITVERLPVLVNISYTKYSNRGEEHQIIDDLLYLNDEHITRLAATIRAPLAAVSHASFPHKPLPPSSITTPRVTIASHPTVITNIQPSSAVPAVSNLTIATASKPTSMTDSDPIKKRSEATTMLSNSDPYMVQSVAVSSANTTSSVRSPSASTVSSSTSTTSSPTSIASSPTSTVSSFADSVNTPEDLDLLL